MKAEAPVWVNGKKRVRFDPSAHVIPDAWFRVLLEGARFPSRKAEEQFKRKLLGHTIKNVAFWEGELEADEGSESKARERAESEEIPASFQWTIRWRWVVKVKK